MSAYQFDPSIAEYLDPLYPDWQEHADAMMALCGERVELGVYAKKVYMSQFPSIYEELYLAVTNATPNKSPNL